MTSPKDPAWSQDIVPKLFKLWQTLAQRVALHSGRHSHRWGGGSGLWTRHYPDLLFSLATLFVCRGCWQLRATSELYVEEQSQSTPEDSWWRRLNLSSTQIKKTRPGLHINQCAKLISWRVRSNKLRGELLKEGNYVGVFSFSIWLCALTLWPGFCSGKKVAERLQTVKYVKYLSSMKRGKKIQVSFFNYRHQLCTGRPPSLCSWSSTQSLELQWVVALLKTTRYEFKVTDAAHTRQVLTGFIHSCQTGYRQTTMIHVCCSVSSI